MFSFFDLAGNSFWCFIHMVLIVQYSCAVVSVFGSGGNSVLVLHTYVHTRFAWAGGTFFPVVLLCQFLVLVENRFWCYILMYLEYITVVVLC